FRQPGPGAGRERADHRRRAGGGGAHHRRAEGREGRAGGDPGGAGRGDRLGGAGGGVQRRDGDRAAGHDHRGALAAVREGDARVRGAVPLPVVQGDRQLGDAVARGGGDVQGRHRVRAARVAAGGAAGAGRPHPPGAGPPGARAVPVNQALGEVLESFRAGYPQAQRMAFDPVEIPHRYSDPRDIEVSALICASLAYGRVDLFKPKLEALHARMGASPAACVRGLRVRDAAEWLRPFVYRFNVGTDIAALLMGIGAVVRERGTLEALFVERLEAAGGSVEKALGGFTRAIRTGAPMVELRKALGKERGLHHLLPAVGGGAAKRLNLYLRWMVRGPDAGD